MKYLLFFILVSQDLLAQRHYAGKGGDNGVFQPNATAYRPGDTIVFRSSLNPLTYVYFSNLRGSNEKKIVLINEGGPIQLSGFDLQDCQFVKITGSGSIDKYGFQVRANSGSGLGIRGKSSDIEVEHFSVAGNSFGVWVKNEADCDTTINNWVLNAISIHDFELKNIRIEGMYLGSTDANNISRPIICGGQLVNYKPSRLGNIKIYNGYIEGTGRPAIMLSNAYVGMSEIHNNEIRNVGYEFNDAQGTGISLGLYTRAYVHDNKIRNTLTWGIASLGGSGLIRIENNRIDSSGYLSGRRLNWPQNIFIDTRATDDTTQFIIKGNTLSNPGYDVGNIEVGQTVKSYSWNNIVAGNLENGREARCLINPGIKWTAGKKVLWTATRSGKKYNIYSDGTWAWK